MARYIKTLLIGAGLMAPASLMAVTSDQVADVLSLLIATVATMEDNGFRTAHMEADNLIKGQHTSYSFTRTLYGGNTYVITAIGGEGIEDLDIYLYDSGGNLVAKDSEVSAVAMVSVEPKRESTYTIKVVPYKWTSGYADAFFAVVIGFK
ncbi:MAG: hypothetical protein ABIM59_03010 [candidate division WOR-3 bacterium]